MNIYEKIRDIETRRNRLTLPKKNEHTITWWYRHGKTIASRVGTSPPKSVEHDTDVMLNELSDCVKEIYVDEDAYKEAKNQYYHRIWELDSEFETALYDYLGIPDHPKRKILFNMAKENSVSQSYTGIVEMAEELVELLS